MVCMRDIKSCVCVRLFLFCRISFSFNHLIARQLFSKQLLPAVNNCDYVLIDKAFLFSLRQLFNNKKLRQIIRWFMIHETGEKKIVFNVNKRRTMRPKLNHPKIH